MTKPAARQQPRNQQSGLWIAYREWGSQSDRRMYVAIAGITLAAAMAVTLILGGAWEMLRVL